MCFVNSQLQGKGGRVVLPPHSLPLPKKMSSGFGHKCLLLDVNCSALQADKKRRHLQ